ncbi:MAG: TIGR03084 family metal-binding protein [Myxococcota bacterium]
MLQISVDLLAEVDDLHALVETLEPEDWERPTTFMNWTPWDVIAHLHFFDEVSLVALEGREPFGELQKEFIGLLQEGLGSAEIAKRKLGDLSPKELTTRWRERNRAMAEQLGNSDPKRRLPWFGPDMGVQMFTTARLMETWAHGQELWDLKGRERSHSDRIKHICEIGVRTFGWTFMNRGEQPPGPPPYVRLTAPSGGVWEWQEPSETEIVRGSAVDFARVVTQVRNIADTPLEVVGPVANAWMAIAQCFAGGAADPPAPGTRTI